MMRALLAAVVLLGALPAAEAQPKLQKIDIIGAGIFTVTNTKEIKTNTISTGQRTTATTSKLIRRATTIEPKKDLIFGIDIQVFGTPPNATVPIHVIWHYPEPGLRNPDTNETKLTDEYDDSGTTGKTTTFYWTLGDTWTQVLGEWVIELRSGDRLLAKQSFILQR